MENISVTETKKGTRVTSPSEDNAYLFFYHKGIVHFEFLEKGRTVNRHCYLEIMARLREAVRRRRPELWPDAWILHHDNAAALDALAAFGQKKIDNEIGPSTIFARFGPRATFGYY
jgi:hypothetical protein